MGAIDWDRRLLDSLIPLPDGTTCNAYLVEGSEKTALLDTVDPPMVDGVMRQLDGMIPNVKVEVLLPVLCKKLPSLSVFESLDDLAEAIADKRKESGFIL
jgi:hypothetical protein